MKSKQIVFLILITALLSVGIFSGGAVLGFSLARIENSAVQGFLEDTGPLSAFVTSSTDEYPADPPDNEQALFKPFWQVWNIIHEEYVDQPVDDIALMRGAIQGALEALEDPQTSYMDPEDYMQANIPLIGSYEGIGAWVDTDGEYLTIISPMPGSPAERVGMKPGDEVIAVDGDDMTGIDPNLVVRRVMGPAGTTVLLTVRREGEAEPIDFSVVRQEIEVASVQSEILPENIAYVRLLTFSGETVRDLRNALRSTLAEEPNGLILDLRGNGGGFLDTAIDVTSEFIGEGLIVREVFGDGSEQEYQASGKGLATEIPMVVLINGGSASASEIVAGAIQDYERGVLLGETSFGKGSVQFWIELDDDEGAVRVTVARWYTPNGTLIDQLGLEPDIIVPMTEEDFEAGTDPQLDKAIEILTNGTDLRSLISEGPIATHTP